MLLIYTVPTKPSRTRWQLWRELRRVGAILLRDGVAILPESPSAKTWMRTVAEGVTAGGGKAQIVRSRFSLADERDIARDFQRDRSREYEEIIESGRGLLDHIEREAGHAQFTFAELAELEADLEKLRRWLVAARARDRFDSPGAAQAEAVLTRCERQIARFADRTSRAEQAPAPHSGRAARTRRGARAV
jgi:hypothetical protein